MHDHIVSDPQVIDILGLCAAVLASYDEMTYKSGHVVSIRSETVFK